MSAKPYTADEIRRVADSARLDDEREARLLATVQVLEVEIVLLRHAVNALAKLVCRSEEP